jgi:hypothetical protein
MFKADSRLRISTFELHAHSTLFEVNLPGIVVKLRGATMAQVTDGREDSDRSAAERPKDSIQSPLAVGKADYRATLAVLQGSERGRVVPAVFDGDPQDGRVGIERVQDQTAPPGQLRKSDIDAVLRDVVAGKGWSKNGQEGWKGIFSSVAGDPRSAETAETLSYIVDKFNAALGKDGPLKLDKKTEPNGTERYYVSMATDHGAKKTEIGSRSLPAEYKPILDAAKNDKTPDGKLAWDNNARKAWQSAYDYLSKLPGATADSVSFGLNSLGARMNEAVGQDRVGMVAGFQQGGGVWTMTLGKTSAERLEGGMGTNPKAGVTLGPFTPPNKAPEGPERKI